VFKSPGEDTGEKPLDVDLGGDIFNATQKPQATEAKTNK
jgi:hypothetical protein